MAKRRRSAPRKGSAQKKGLASLVLPIKLSAIKHDARASIKLLEKAAWSDNKGGKAKALTSLKSVLKTMQTLCPSMGFKIGFK